MLCQHLCEAGEHAMENDSIRPSGTNTLVDIWVDGKVRAICVSQDAISAFIGFDRASGMTERDRSEFVRANLSLVVAAAKNQLRETDPSADSVTLDVGQLPRTDGASGDRRKIQRRKDDRRKADRARTGQVERRRRDRRQGERRTKSPKPE